jgi:ubiquitin-protein ligase E3 B
MNITLVYKFSGTFLNAIVGKKNSFDDLKTIDPDLYKSLVYIKDMDEDASELSLTFMFTDPIRKKSIQLLPNGHMIPVTKYLFIKSS